LFENIVCVTYELPEQSLIALVACAPYTKIETKPPIRINPIDAFVSIFVQFFAFTQKNKDEPGGFILWVCSIVSFGVCQLQCCGG